jgi:type I restriction enzyme S subunit
MLREPSWATLPTGWAWTTLGEIGDVNLGKTPKKNQYAESGAYKVVKYRDIVSGKVDWTNNDKGFVVDDDGMGDVLRELREGDVLVSASAHSSEHIGKKVAHVSTIPKSYTRVFFVGELCCVRVDERSVSPAMVCHYLSSERGYRSIQNHVRGVHLVAGEARSIAMPLPPLPEQGRLVAKIEDLFAKLDAGIDALNKVKAQLEVYREAVLRDAFNGTLTREWREANRSELQVAAERLAQLVNRKARAGSGGKPSSQPLSTSGSPALPDGWLPLTLVDAVGSERDSIRRGPFGSAIKKAFFVPHGYKVYEQSNVIHGDFERGTYFVDEAKYLELKSFSIKAGDILMTCSGTVGRIAVVPEQAKPGLINQALLKLSLDHEVVETPFFMYLFKHTIEQAIQHNTRGSAMVNISSVEDLRRIFLPIPPLPEQRQIVDEVEQHLSVVEQAGQTVEQAIARSERFRHAILRKAFEGRLVPQDPSDEPAEKLLQRIREERARLKPNAKTRARKKRRTQQMRLA